ncbi:hypothetical protein N2152v2_001431 [Parachlorella kessleri]
MAHAHISVENWGKNKSDSQNSPLRVQHKRKSSQPQRSHMDGDTYQQQESDGRTLVRAVQLRKQIACGETAAPLQEPVQPPVVPAFNAPAAVKQRMRAAVEAAAGPDVKASLVP